MGLDMSLQTRSGEPAAAADAADGALARHRRPATTPKAAGIWRAGADLAGLLEAGVRLDRSALRRALERAFGAGDADGAWDWKDAYEAAETAAVLLLLKYGRAIGLHAGDPRTALRRVERIARLEPPQTRRSEHQVRLQQFSTPLAVAWVAAVAAGLRPGDAVLEPSAGTGTLAAMALPALDPAAGGRLVLNELAADRAGLLARTFADQPVTRHDAAQIRDRLPEVRPSVVIMNPPFSRSAGTERMRLGTDAMHVRAAYAALRPGGRLVAITSAACEPGGRHWNRVFRGPHAAPDVVLSLRLDGALYRSRGTTAESRLTVIERPAEGPGRRLRASGPPPAGSPAELLDAVLERLPPRQPLGPAEAPRGRTMAGHAGRAGRNGAGRRPAKARPHEWGPAAELDYTSERRPESAAERTAADRPYQPWRPAAVIVPGAEAHPTALVEAAAMAAVPHRTPGARPRLPVSLAAEGRLSDAQLESVVLASEALGEHLRGMYQISENWENVRWLDEPAAEAAARAGEEAGGGPEADPMDDAGLRLGPPVRLRQGWMLGDGTGCGKGRQVAGIVLEQWLRGRRRALWLSQSDKLIEDARRDWRAVGGRDEDVVQLTKVRQRDPVPRSQGILFATYATLRSPGRNGGRARLQQIVEWLAGGSGEAARRAFDGVVVFDEAHAMQNAAGGQGRRGKIAPSQQGLAGLRLQNALPDARVVYVSATGASSLEGLAYAQRLGLWASARTPFATREQFVEAMDKGGVAALEIVARDLKAFGLYQTRALSYEGVEIDILTHELTPAQRAIWDEYAGAFRIIHDNIEEALEATGVTEAGETNSAQSKAAAISAFEAAKQRFFGHLLTSMKTPTLVRAIERDLEANRAAVVQIVSTGEALTERRLAEVPADEWEDLRIDLTPREYVLDYLRHAFPTTLHRTVTNAAGDEETFPVFGEDGQPVVSEDAVRMRDELLERLGALPPVGSALDLLLDHFGHEAVAEITGRSRRVLKLTDERGERHALRPRAGSANRRETHAFMNGDKRVLVFSGAGNTGRSYHADLGCGNTRRRVHYLLEAGWRADQAIQGLGRTHRTHQASAPLFRPVTTDVRGERRFISTIARRLDALGAITRGQRDAQTAMGADKSLFRAADNFESPYALAALRQFYLAVANSKVPGWPVRRFCAVTGLRILDRTGGLLERLPPMPVFLNRLLALPIGEQNELFGELETRLEANIQQAVDAGTFTQGVERIAADSLKVAGREVACTHPETESDTSLIEIERRDRVRPLTSGEALLIRRREEEWDKRPARLLVNRQSRRAALAVRAPAGVLADGAVEARVRLLRPVERTTIAERALAATRWREAPEAAWRRAWDAEAARAAESFRESRFWLVTGLLLPIWHRLAETDLKVYRLTTDEGERLIGRALAADEAIAFRAQLGLDRAAGPRLRGAEVYAEAVRGRAAFRLAVGWRIRGRRHMGCVRVEVEGPDASSLALLKQLGCRTELVMHRTRIFAPDAGVLGRVLERYPLAAGG